MSLLSELSGQAEPCDAALECNNYLVARTSQIPSACLTCRYASHFPGHSNNWYPIVPSKKHPLDVKAKREKQLASFKVKQEASRNRDRRKMRVQHSARQAEKQTERRIIHATVNSGRSNRDADHVFAGRITLDTKLQSTQINPRISVAELAKSRTDARRAGNPIGGLVLRNKNGSGFVVLAEEDFALLMRNIK